MQLLRAVTSVGQAEAELDDGCHVLSTPPEELGILCEKRFDNIFQKQLCKYVKNLDFCLELPRYWCYNVHWH